jgi:hypothetical protein
MIKSKLKSKFIYLKNDNGKIKEVKTNSKSFKIENN